MMAATGSHWENAIVFASGDWTADCFQNTWRWPTTIRAIGDRRLLATHRGAGPWPVADCGACCQTAPSQASMAIKGTRPNDSIPEQPNNDQRILLRRGL